MVASKTSEIKDTLYCCLVNHFKVRTIMKSKQGVNKRISIFFVLTPNIWSVAISVSNIQHSHSWQIVEYCIFIKQTLGSSQLSMNVNVGYWKSYRSYGCCWIQKNVVPHFTPWLIEVLREKFPYNIKLRSIWKLINMITSIEFNCRAKLFHINSSELFSRSH